MYSNYQNAIKMQNSYILLLLVFALSFYTIKAQEPIKRWCAFDEAQKVQLEQDTVFRLQEKRINNLILQNIKNGYLEARQSDYILPVVVHIVSPPGTPIGIGNNLTNEEVMDGLQLLNKAFSNSGEFYSPEGIDIGIQFCLAEQTPDGKATDGITRHESDLVADPKCSNYSTNYDDQLAIKSIISWNCKEYINIWLVTDLFNEKLGCSLAGYATYPGNSCAWDGIMQESRYWITKPGTEVTAHEMGHYLGLYHTFEGGCKNDDCLSDGDRVCDTPPDDSPSYAACNTNSCISDVPDLPDDNTNYMDYSACQPPHFTVGQKERMIQALLVSRSQLLNSLGCSPLTNKDITLQIGNDANCPTDYCPQLTVINTGREAIHQFSIAYELNDGTLDTIQWVGELDSKSQLLISLPCVEAAGGDYVCSASVISIDGFIDEVPINSTLMNVLIQVQEIILDFEGLPTSGRNINFINNSIGAINFEWEFGDGHTSVESNPRHLYFVDGTYTVKLTASNTCDTVVLEKQIDVVGCIQGWRGFVSGLNSYQEPDEEICSYIKNGILKIDPELSERPYYWTRFSYCNTICTGSNFTVQFRIRNPKGEGGIDAYDTGIRILTSGERVGVTLMGSAWAQSYSSIQAGSTSLTNKPELVVPLNDWVELELKIKNDTVFYQYNGSNYFYLPFDAYLCDIEELIISFKGSGEIDWVRVLDENDRLVYFEDFLDCNQPSDPLPCQISPLSATFTPADPCLLSAWSIDAEGSRGNYIYYLKNANTLVEQKDSVFKDLSPGYYVLGVRSDCPYQDTSIQIIVPTPLRIKVDSVVDVYCSQFGEISVIGEGGVQPYSYSLDNMSIQHSGIFKDLLPGKHKLIITDSVGCEIIDTIDVKNNVEKIQLWIVDSKLSMDCQSDSTFLLIGSKSFDEQISFSLNGSPFSTNHLLQNLPEGRYQLIGKDNYGCLTDTLNFEIKDNRDHQINRNAYWVCFGDSIQVASHYYRYNGVYYDTLLTVNGCDSILITELSLYERNELKLDYSICEGDSILLGGRVIRNTGIYYDSLTTVTGCDSLIIVDLNIIPNNKVEIDTFICEGENYVVGFKKYNNSGFYLDTLSSSSFCDSLVITNLKVIPNEFVNLEIAICPNEPYQLNGKVYSKGGTYIDTLKTSIFGCDSVVKMDVKVLEADTVSKLYTLCPGDSLWIGDTLLMTTANWDYWIPSSMACDTFAQVEVIMASSGFCDSLYCQYYLPNIFSPNQDGVNDDFMPFSSQVKFTELSVYDRFGGLVYFSGGSDIKWDGTRSGKELPAGVYVYILRGVCADGRSITIPGTINLVR